MMYAKLALRNVRRTARDYLIYVVTLVLSVGMFYGFFSLVSPYYNATLLLPILQSQNGTHSFFLQAFLV